MIKTYKQWVDELWADASDHVVLAALKLSTLPMDEEPIRLHCLLTMRLIHEVERLKAELNEQRISQP